MQVGRFKLIVVDGILNQLGQSLPATDTFHLLSKSQYICVFTFLGSRFVGSGSFKEQISELVPVGRCGCPRKEGSIFAETSTHKKTCVSVPETASDGVEYLFGCRFHSDQWKTYLFTSPYHSDPADLWFLLDILPLRPLE